MSTTTPEHIKQSHMSATHEDDDKIEFQLMATCHPCRMSDIAERGLVFAPKAHSGRRKEGGTKKRREEGRWKERLQKEGGEETKGNI